MKYVPLPSIRWFRGVRWFLSMCTHPLCSAMTSVECEDFVRCDDFWVCVAGIKTKKGYMSFRATTKSSNPKASTTPVSFRFRFHPTQNSHSWGHWVLHDPTLASKLGWNAYESNISKPRSGVRWKHGMRRFSEYGHLGSRIVSITHNWAATRTYSWWARLVFGYFLLALWTV